MDIKQTFENGIAWVKSHPWAAGAILLVLVLVGWWISKQAGSGSGASLGGDTSSAEDASATLGDNSPTSGSLLESLQSSGGGVSAPSVSALPDPVSSLPDFESAPLESMFGNGYIPEAFYEAPTISANMEAASDSGLLQSYISSSPVAAMAKPVNKVVDVLQSYISSSPVAEMAKPTPAASLSSVTSGSAGGSGAGGKLTPSQQVGKGKHFSGLYQGVVYVDGYPATGAGGSNPGTQLNTGTISKSPVASMKKPM